MIERTLEEIVEADLQALVSRGVSEGRRLDYKLQLPGRPADVRDFLIDVASFANGDGGDMIFGMAEDGNSVAKALPGIATDNLDEQLQGLEARVRDCIDVRLPSFRIHRVDLANGHAALVIRVRASLLAPHRVRYDKHIGGRPFEGPKSLMTWLERSKATYEMIDGNPTSRAEFAAQLPPTDA